MKISLKTLNAGSPEFRNLEKMLDAELYERYPETQKNFASFNVIENSIPAVILFDGISEIGCGCLRRYEGNVYEVKRVFVTSEYRGKGLASLIVKEIEKYAKECGAEKLILETGINQPEAAGLYLKLGYTVTENYGHYADSSESICMMKEFK